MALESTPTFQFSEEKTVGWPFRRKGPSEAPKEHKKSTKCIGRDDELCFVSNQFKKSSSATLIYGDPAIGKSELLRDIEKTYNQPDNSLHVGLWETSSQEDTLLYALANLLDKVHKGPLKDQASVLWSKIKESFSTLESFNNFVQGLLKVLQVPGATLPSFLREQFKLEVDPMRTPLLNREIFFSVVEKLKESIEGVKIILLLDNLSIGFENQPPPEYVQKAYGTLRDVLERIGQIQGLHLVVSWKLTHDTKPSFEKVKGHFMEYGHEVYPLGPIKNLDEYKKWLEKNCKSFNTLEEKSKKGLLEFSGGLPGVGAEWIKQEGYKGQLCYEKLKEIAKDVKERKYGYLSRYLNEQGQEKLRELVYQLSVLPSMSGLTLHQIAELLPISANSTICQCGLKEAEKNSFIDWQSQCQDNLRKAMEMAIFRAKGEAVKDGQYLFDHETKKDYIRNLALGTPKGQHYLKRAFDFSIYHLGFPTEEHPLHLLHLAHAQVLMEQIPNTSSELIHAFDAFIYALMTNFEDKDLTCVAINSPGFGQLPPHLRACLLSEEIKFPDKVNIDQNHKDLLETLKGDLTYFQTLTVAKALTNAINNYGRLGKLEKMGQYLERSKALYETHETPELALSHATALTNAISDYGRLDKLSEMGLCLEKSKALYETHRTPELALSYAIALVNTTGRYGECGKLDEMGQCLERSKAFYENHKTPELALSHAMALANAINEYGRLGKLTEMGLCLENSKALYETYNVAELALEYAIALTNSTIPYGEHGKLEEMGQCLKESKATYDTHKTLELVALECAKVIYNASIYYKRVDAGRAKEILKQLEDFLKDKPQVAKALLTTVLESRAKQNNAIQARRSKV